MLVRVVFGVGLLALGYYVGREIGRNESLRETLAREKSDQGRVPGEPADTDAAGGADSPRDQGQA
jgi:hypothetical protein